MQKLSIVFNGGTSRLIHTYCENQYSISRRYSHLSGTLRSSYTEGNPDRFAGKNPTSYEPKQKSIGFSDTLALKSHTTFPVKSVGISCRVTGP